jgi:uncharacterized LabA/DUF88 family protein
MKPRSLVLIDGQNLFHAARLEFGYEWPNFDAGKLSRLLAEKTETALWQTRFYVGVPAAAVDPWSHAFWANRCAQMQRSNITTITRTIQVQTDWSHPAAVTHKGIDLRIALDLVRLAREGETDSLILVSNEPDFVEAVGDARIVARKAKRRLRIASAFPDASRARQGVPQTTWIPISASEYAACLDLRDYGPSARQLRALKQVPPVATHTSKNLVLWPKWPPRP